MTSIKETFSSLLAFCDGNPPVTGGFPSQRPVTRSFDFFYLRLNKRLSKQSRRRWFETPSPLWSHCNVAATRIYLAYQVSMVTAWPLMAWPQFVARSETPVARVACVASLLKCHNVTRLMPLTVLDPERFCEMVNNRNSMPNWNRISVQVIHIHLMSLRTWK